MSRELVDIEVELHHETKPGVPDEGAYKVSTDGDEKTAVWVPKSQSEFYASKGRIGTLTLSRWLAEEKRLV